MIGFRDPGNDVYGGGAGADVLDFRGTDVGVSVSLDGVANDGPAGEADNAGTDIENLKGGNGDDTLIGDSDRNLIEGFAGVTIRLPRALRRAAARRARVPARVVSLETGAHGPKTTVRRVRLR